LSTTLQQKGIRREPSKTEKSLFSYLYPPCIGLPKNAKKSFVTLIKTYTPWKMHGGLM